MFATDFEYDGRYLSDFGFIICDFNSSNKVETVSSGSKISFNKVSRHQGKKHGLSNTKYDECIKATFSICKNPDMYDDLKITNDEYRDIMRWLNRREFLKFQILSDKDDNFIPCYYEASFNVEKVKIVEVLYGLTLTMETNKPFGYGQEQTVKFNFGDTSKTYLLNDISDEIGHTYPNLTIMCQSSGELKIINEGVCETKILNCENGENIIIDGDTQIIQTDKENHDIYNDFNYEFFKIVNTNRNRINKISATLPCTVLIKYRPIIKDAP